MTPLAYLFISAALILATALICNALKENSRD